MKRVRKNPAPEDVVRRVAASIPVRERAATAAGATSAPQCPARFCSSRDRCQMSSEIIVQYIGFEAKRLTREYTFNVREAGQEREFRLNIANEAFVSHRASYQDAPGICALRLHVELAAFSNHPPVSQYDITVAEMDSYRGTRYPKAGKNLWGRKPKEDF